MWNSQSMNTRLPLSTTSSRLRDSITAEPDETTDSPVLNNEQSHVSDTTRYLYDTIGCVKLYNVYTIMINARSKTDE